MKLIKNSSQFEQEVLQAKGTVLVDFFANWCGPCKALMPTLEQLSSEGHQVVKVDVDEASDIAAKYNIRSIPTLILFKDGEVASQSVGGKSLADLKKWIEG